MAEQEPVGTVLGLGQLEQWSNEAVERYRNGNGGGTVERERRGTVERVPPERQWNGNGSGTVAVVERWERERWGPWNGVERERRSRCSLFPLFLVPPLINMPSMTSTRSNQDPGRIPNGWVGLKTDPRNCKIPYKSCRKWRFLVKKWFPEVP